MSEAKAKNPQKKNLGGIGRYAPIIGLALVVIIFTALTGGSLLSVTNLQNMVE